MKSSRPRRGLERIYLEAIVLGLCIGIAAMLINRWVGEASWPPRILVLLVIGGLLCLLQFAIGRFWRR